MCICAVPNCNKQAVYLVLLAIYYEDNKDVWVDIDATCPFLCEVHKQENESKKKTEAKHPQSIDYPHSNQYETTGITKYIPISSINKYKGFKQK